MSTKIASLYAEIGAKDTLTPSLANAKKGITDLKGTFAGFAASAAALTGVALAVGKAYQATAGEFVKYASEVRNITQISGESAEATSRLIQVADDYKLSSNDLMTAQRILAKEGYSLNIETMAKLSDEYLKLNTGAERQAFLTEKLGRSGAVFAEMMSQGSAAILNRAAAVSGSLVLDQKALDNARKYEFALDDLNDQWKALKISIGSALVPMVTTAATSLNQLLAIRQDLGSWSATFKMMGGAEESVARQEVALERLARLQRQQRAIGLENYTPTKQAEIISQENENVANSYTAMAYAYNQANMELAAGEVYVADYTSALNYAIPYMDTMQDYQAKNTELTNAWNEAWAQGYRSLREGSKLDQISDSMKKLNVSMEQAQQTQLFNFLAEGLSKTEGKERVLFNVAFAMGEIDEKALDAYLKAQKLLDYLNNIPPNTTKEVIMNVMAYWKNTGNIPGDYVYTTDTPPPSSAGTQTGTGGIVVAPGLPEEKWSGGAARGLFAVGDTSAGWTPYTEVVYAPGGAYVWNASQSRSLFGRGIRGYAEGGATQSDVKWGGMLIGGKGTNPRDDPFTGGGVISTISDAVTQTVSQQITAALVTTANQVTVAVAPMVQEQQQTTSATQQGTQAQAAGNREMVSAIEDMKYLLSAQLANMGGDIISAVLRGT